MAILLGFILGFVVSVPPTGPVALLVLRRALQGAYRHAFLIGLGTTVADLPYIALGALGYGVVLERYPDVASGFDLVGAMVLAVIAVQLWRTPVHAEPVGVERRWGDLATGFVLGIANPTRLFTWTLVAAIAVDRVIDLRATTLVTYTLAVGVGQVAWWAVLALGWQRFGDRVSLRVRSGALRVIAVVAFVLAIVLAVRVIHAVSPG